MFSKQDEVFMRIALKQAEIAFQYGWIPVGALIVKGGIPIAHGQKMGLHHSLFDHAEHNACYHALWSRDGPRNLAGVTVYSTLEPCILCMSMLMTTRVERIVFGLNDPYGGGSFILQCTDHLPTRFQNERPRVEGGCLNEESRDMLRRFFQSQTGRNWGNEENSLVRLCLDE